MRGTVHASRGETGRKCVRYGDQMARNPVDSRQIWGGGNGARMKIEMSWERQPHWDHRIHSAKVLEVVSIYQNLSADI